MTTETLAPPTTEPRTAEPPQWPVASDHIVFLDIETTGLDPERHDVWDIGIIRGDTGEEIEYHVLPDLSKADAGALRITDFYRRTQAGAKPWSWTERAFVASRIANLTAGKHLVGAVPSFDAAFLERFLRANGYAPAWHYHLVDVEALAAGRLGMAPPWDSHELSDRLGIAADTDGKHTGIGDARWAKRMYEAALDPGLVLPTAVPA